jgi:hypothetical protein
VRSALDWWTVAATDVADRNEELIPTARESFVSDAWLLEGLTRSIPALLELARGRLRCVTQDRVAFDVALEQVTGVEFPWYYFGGGVKLRAGAEQFRISFVRPNGAEYASARLLASDGNAGSLLLVGSKASDIAGGRAAGRRWREVLPPPA